MRNFGYTRARSLSDAIALLEQQGATPIAGGTELLNWARIGIFQPAHVVDISRIEDLEGVEPLTNGGLRIGALTKLNDVAQHPLVMERYPVFSQAILKAASAQIRNLATIGGNPLQRVRCAYFRADEPTACNKRRAGSGCAALDGINDRHAIFGWTDECVAVHPADPPVALAALDAAYVIESSEGSRRIPAEELHVLPTRDPAWHNILRRGELITAIELGSPPSHSAYLKIRERESYEYATVSAAVALQMNGDTIIEVRIALGSVAMRPWRLRSTEQLLVGKRVGSPEVTDAIAVGFEDARALPHNSYKITLARNAALRAVELAVKA